MGMNSVVSYIFIFLLIVSMVFVLVIANTIVIKQKSDAIRQEIEIVKKRLNTDYEIMGITSNQGNLNITMRNTGVEKLNGQNIDVYINGERVNRTNITSGLRQEFDMINPRIWDSYEVLDLNVLASINQSMNNSVIVSVGNGRTKEIVFSMEEMEGELYYVYLE
jgi:hypothetical protein